MNKKEFAEWVGERAATIYHHIGRRNYGLAEDWTADIMKEAAKIELESEEEESNA